MQAVKDFLNIIKSSVTPRDYKVLVKKPSSFSWKFFFLFYFLATFIIIAIPVKDIITFPLEKEVKQFVQSSYPEDLEISIINNTLTINQDRPYYIDSFLVFESDENITNLQKVTESPAEIIITETSFYAKKSSGEISAYPIPNFKGKYFIDKNKVNNWTDMLLGNVWIKNKLYIPALVAIMFIAVYLFTTLPALFQLYIYAFIAWIIAKFSAKKQKMSLGKVVQLSIHSIIPIVVVKYLLGNLLSVNISGWLYFAVYLIWTLYLISTLPTNSKK